MAHSDPIQTGLSKKGSSSEDFGMRSWLLIVLAVLLTSWLGAWGRAGLHERKIWESEHPTVEPIFWFFALALISGLLVLVLVPKPGSKPIDRIRSRSPFITLFALVIISFLTVFACLKETVTIDPATNQPVLNPLTHLPEKTLTLNVMDVATGGLLGIVGAVITLIGIQVFLFSEKLSEVDNSVKEAETFLDKAKGAIGDAQTSIRNVQTQIEKVRGDFQAEIRGTAEASIRALEKALELRQELLQIPPETTTSATEIHHGLDALGSQYRSWANRLRVTIPFESQAWLAAFPIVLRRQARNVESRRIITDAKSYCSLLLLTLADLLKVQPSATLCYYQVTPVHPKDWHNWPHAANGSKVYYEDDFIGLYRRSLKAVITELRTRRPAGHSPLEHGRFFLRAGHNGKTNQISGWELPDNDEFDNAAGSALLNTALPLNAWPNITDCEFEKFLKEKVYHLTRSQSCFAPIWRPGWLGQAGIPISKLAEIHLKPEGKCTCSTKLLEAAKDQHSKNLEAQLDSLDTAAKANQGLAEFLAEISPEKAPMLHNNFIELLKRYHGIICSLDLTKEAANTLEIAVSEALRLWETCRSMEQPKWSNLYTTFATDLHTDAQLARVVSVDDTLAKLFSGIEGEFGIFGLKDAASPIQWKLVLSTSLHFPFRVADIHIISESDGEVFNRYKGLIEELINKKDNYPLLAPIELPSSNAKVVS